MLWERTIKFLRGKLGNFSEKYFFFQYWYLQKFSLPYIFAPSNFSKWDLLEFFLLLGTCARFFSPFLAQEVFLA